MKDEREWIYAYRPNCSRKRRFAACAQTTAICIAVCEDSRAVKGILRPRALAARDLRKAPRCGTRASLRAGRSPVRAASRRCWAANRKADGSKPAHQCKTAFAVSRRCWAGWSKPRGGDPAAARTRSPHPRTRLRSCAPQCPAGSVRARPSGASMM